jgi:hypothetical protein
MNVSSPSLRMVLLLARNQRLVKYVQHLLGKKHTFYVEEQKQVGSYDELIMSN